MAIRWGLVSTALLAVTAANAQERTGCDDDNGWGWGWRNGPRARACEVRELTLPARGTLSIDAGPNGSISVTGENRRDVLVRAKVQAWGRDEAAARQTIDEIEVQSDSGVRAVGPSSVSRGGWSVSYEVHTPRKMDLSLETLNGGIAITDVSGDLTFQARNGGISLEGVAGNVRGRTTNGGVDARLTGDTWEGAGLDLETTNGGVRLRIPEAYSARLETSTVNGGIDIDFPVTMQGRIGKQVSTTLGKGGALVRAETTNGQVRISRGTEGLRRVQ